MKRAKTLYVLAGVLLVICALTFGVSRYEQHKEDIKNSDETVLSVVSEDVTGLSWEYADTSLSFHKDDIWQYDEDADFPVSEEKIEELIDVFSDFTAAFEIADVEDLSQYGLEDPSCSILIETAEDTTEIALGDFSVMDEQRYVSIGDGKVYLASVDPMDSYEIELKDMIENDTTPQLSEANTITFAGEANYDITYQEDSDISYDENDVYVAKENGNTLALDPTLVGSYLSTVGSLDLTDYVTYKATEEELSSFGMDDPQLDVTIAYTTSQETSEEEDKKESSDEEKSFVMHIGRSAEDIKKAEEQAAEEAEDEEDEIPGYVRIGDSSIIYQITESEYDALMAAATGDLRHQELFWGDFSHVTQMDVTLDGEDYSLTTEKNKGENVWYYDGEKLETDELQLALTTLTATEFTEEASDGKEELSITLHLEDENFDTVTLTFYRKDGTNVLAEVDGTPTALVARSEMVDLIEAVNAIVLE